MKAKDLSKLQDYLERLANQRNLIEMTKADKNAPIDATRPLEVDLEKFKDDSRDKIIELLVKYVVEREMIHRKGEDDGR
jgi:hypothetical protein